MSRQRVEFTIHTRSEERHLIRIELPMDPITGKRRRVNRTVRGTKSEAKKIARQMLAQRDGGIDLSPGKVTLADWLTNWLERHHREGHIGANIFDRYEGIVRNHLIPAIGHILIGELRAYHVNELKDSWLTGKSITTTGPLKPATVYKQLNILRSCLSNAVSLGIIQHNPASSVKSPSVQKKEEQRALDTEEIRMLLDVASGTRFHIPIRFTLAAGLRQAELLDLKWSDFDIDGSLLNCPGTKSPKSRRAIELSRSTVSLLKAHRQEQRERRLKSGPAWQENGLVFPTTRGARWHKRTFYRDYKKVVSLSDLTDQETIHWHTLRHTAASQWIKQGADVFTVSRRLGHASAAFTMDVYAHLLKGQQTVAAEAMDALIARA